MANNIAPKSGLMAGKNGWTGQIALGKTATAMQLNKSKGAAASKQTEYKLYMNKCILYDIAD